MEAIPEEGGWKKKQKTDTHFLMKMYVKNTKKIWQQFTNLIKITFIIFKNNNKNLSSGSKNKNSS